MKAIYFECNMGAAGDMLMAALLELCDDKQKFLDRLNAAGIDDVVVSVERSEKCGIIGTRVNVAVGGRVEESGDNYHYEHDHDFDFNNDNDDEHHAHHNHNNNSNDTHDDKHHHEQHHHNNNHADEHHHHHAHSHDEHHHHEHDEHHHEHDHDHHHKKHEHHKHEHNDYNTITKIINTLNVSDYVKQNALSIYKLIADAESKAHGVPVDKIHFHEVGEKDAIADIVGVCMLMEEIAPAVVYTSPINLGSGHVRCAHGVLPVPAPATAHILQHAPIYSDQTVGELCTPTGAAILKHFTKKFRGMPMLSVAKVGYGMGKKNFKKANCVRAYMGELVQVVSDDINEYVIELASDIDDVQTQSGATTHATKSVNPPPAHLVELSCNLDDMTPEAIAFAQEILLREGALDVWTAAIGMKKSRPGMMLSCLCHNDAREKMLALIFKHTTTLGIRESTVRRHTLQREMLELETEWGPVKIKTSFGYGVERSKAEYDDVARIAREKDLSMDEVLNSIWSEP